MYPSHQIKSNTTNKGFLFLGTERLLINIRLINRCNLLPTQPIYYSIKIILPHCKNVQDTNSEEYKQHYLEIYSQLNPFSECL